MNGRKGNGEVSFEEEVRRAGRRIGFVAEEGGKGKMVLCSSFVVYVRALVQVGRRVAGCF